jgi:hypothetical protein
MVCLNLFHYLPVHIVKDGTRNQRSLNCFNLTALQCVVLGAFNYFIAPGRARGYCFMSQSAPAGI